jgi:hypothetical protein
MFALLLVGCAAQVPIAHESGANFDDVTEQAVVASALVFDPPTSMDAALLDLSRESRQRGAFMGYEEQTTTFYNLELDNYQVGGHHGRDFYDRHDYISRSGVSYR